MRPTLAVVSPATGTKREDDQSDDADRYRAVGGVGRAMLYGART